MTRAFLAATFALAAGAAGAGTFDSAGTLTGTDTSKGYELGDDHTVMMTAAHYDKMEMTDPNHPFAGLSGDCFGSIEVMAGTPSGSGHCVLDDGGDNMVAIHWTATGMTPEGASTGDWEVTGGTGTFEGASGGGTYTDSVDQADGTFSNAIEGEVTVK